jgi:hypothetical protein
MTAPPSLDTSQVLELRQYTLHPGKRDTLIELFDREFVETQEAHGMRVLAQFRDLDRPDHFVWLRGFPDLASRGSQLEGFYTGPVWKAHRDAANATMIDSDDVLLLRPVDPSTGFILPAARAAAPAAPAAATAATASAPATAFAPADGGLIVATIYLLHAPVDDAFLHLFATRIAPAMTATGAPPIAQLRTEYGKNDFGLPVREGEHAFVWFTAFASAADHARHRTELERSLATDATWRTELAARCKSPPQILRLAPTARSLLRHTNPVGYTLHRTGDPHDFDFIAGTWSIANRRLRARGVGSTEWDEFPSTGRAALHLGGLANVEELSFPTRGAAGLTVRHFDVARRQWSIHWISSTTGAIEAPVVGGFSGDRGEFYGDDHHDGQPIKVRFIWTRLGPDAARWEQAFSHRGGPWELNWIMDFTRTSR